MADEYYEDVNTYGDGYTQADAAPDTQGSESQHINDEHGTGLDGEITYSSQGNPTGWFDSDGAWNDYGVQTGPGVNNDTQNPVLAGIKSLMDGVGSMFAPTVDSQGRATQSFAASMVLGAVNGVMKDMMMDKQVKASKDLEDQRSANRIKEAESALNLTRNAASAMPAPNGFNARKIVKPTGLLGG